MSLLNPKYPIQSLLSAKQLLVPEIHDGKIYFIGNMSGMYSLYDMDINGSVPSPLLPDGTALQNPHLMAGSNFVLLPKLNKIMVMVDQNGDELYQPCLIPLTGGIPEPIFNEYPGMQVIMIYYDHQANIAYFNIDNRTERGNELLQVNFNDNTRISYGKTDYGKFLAGVTKDHSTLITSEVYSNGDSVFYLHKEGVDSLLYGIPMDQRKEDEEIILAGMYYFYFIENNTALLTTSTLFNDKRSICRLPLDGSGNLEEIGFTNFEMDQVMEGLQRLYDDVYFIHYNVDGCSEVYLAEYLPDEKKMSIKYNVIGKYEPITNGVILGLSWDQMKVDIEKSVKEVVVSYTKATMPSQIFILQLNEGEITSKQLSNERILGINQDYLSEGENANYTSFDGLLISARLYRPSPKLGFEGPRPLVVYIHGGPQGQERPDFTWFSMPIIQFLTLHGFAVFVPNVRGSTGYGFNYMKMVDKDWGGNDRLDHIEGLKFLENDPLIDSTRRAVMGRSYGGYMTLTLMARHPELWSAGCDLFGPYDLIGFYHRLPPSWQSYFDITIGHPEKDKDFFIERSPKTYVDSIESPLLIIQGRNDPRVVVDESEEINKTMTDKGKISELLIFDDEGHDIIKFKNKIICYESITTFFLKHLQ
ncbi:MAG: prolyl oligopeptidase family serine peptidase [Candidatus Heimdallarchaeota archaeon]|nr:prolyl oligopeptidase family serine peptidase [Candidatus Heimdallarchaeota archaeon]